MSDTSASRAKEGRMSGWPPSQTPRTSANGIRTARIAARGLRRGACATPHGTARCQLHLRRASSNQTRARSSSSTAQRVASISVKCSPSRVRTRAARARDVVKPGSRVEHLYAQRALGTLIRSSMSPRSLTCSMALATNSEISRRASSSTSSDRWRRGCDRERARACGGRTRRLWKRGRVKHWAKRRVPDVPELQPWFHSP